MSLKTMNTIRKFISTTLNEDEMEVDLDFTEKYLSQFESIDRQTIEVLIENGYQTKEQILAFDLKEDLPLLPVLNMAQKSLLRVVLKQFYESEELEIKINDLKGEDNPSPNTSFIDSIPANKRKRDSTAQLVTKRLRSSPEKPIIPNDGLGSRMRQMVNKRKSIRSFNNQTDSDNEPEILTSVDPKRFQFAKNNNFGFSSKNTYRNELQEDEEEEEEDEEEEPQVVQIKPLRGSRTRPSTSTYNWLPSTISQRSVSSSTCALISGEEVRDKTQELNETKQLRGRRSIAPSTVSVAPSRVLNKGSVTRSSIGTPVKVKTELITTPKSGGKSSSSNNHIPTPTELEVRERLAQKKALAQQKGGRKRR